MLNRSIMKKILFVFITLLSTIAYAQQEKGNWMLGVSSSNLGFTSNTGNSSITNVEYSGWRTDTLQIENALYTMSGIFPYTHNIQEDKNSEVNVNLHLGYFVLDQFVLGIKAGVNSETSVLKSSPLSAQLLALSPDSLGNDLGQYPLNYDLYDLISSTANNDFTSKTLTWNIAPFARYYYALRNGSLFVDASYELGQGESELKSGSALMENASLSYQKINAGLGYSFELGSKVNLEPMISYQSINSTTESTQDVPNPFIPSDIGVETTTFDRKSGNLHFSLGISAYL